MTLKNIILYNKPANFSSINTDYPWAHSSIGEKSTEERRSTQRRGAGGFPLIVELLSHTAHKAVT
jgi:hypothetical protein